MVLPLVRRWSPILVLLSLVTRNLAIFYAQNEGNDFPRIGRRSPIASLREDETPKVPELELEEFYSKVMDQQRGAARNVDEDYFASAVDRPNVPSPAARKRFPWLSTAYHDLLKSVAEKGSAEPSDDVSKTNRSPYTKWLDSPRRFSLTKSGRERTILIGNPNNEDKQADNPQMFVSRLTKLDAVIPRRQYGVDRRLFGSLAS